MKKMNFLKMLFLLIVMNGCVFGAQSKLALDLAQFEEAFQNDCNKIKTIYAGIHSSGYYLENDKFGNYTIEPIGLKKMVKWLNACGVDLDTISKY